MGAAREKDQGDFDLERFIDMFDTALTSRDPRVIETLRKLMMIVALTAPESRNVIEDRNRGPLRTLYDDVRQAHRRCSDLEDMVKMFTREQTRAQWDKVESQKYTLTAAAQLSRDIDKDIITKLSQDIPSLKNQIKGFK